MRSDEVLGEALSAPGPVPAAGPSAVRVALLFPELLGTYGDGGNALVLAKRLTWRDVPCEVVTVEAGDAVPDSCDLYLLGGGEDGPQTEASRELVRQRSLHRAVERGAAVFAVCAGLQVVGESFADKAGRAVPGLGLLDCHTVKTDEPRAVGELLVEASALLPRLTGFENHGGRTRVGPGARPLGRVVAGVGNGDGGEGVLPRDPQGPKVLGTYLHGPVLARNPALADLLIGWVLDRDPATLAPLDDADADRLRADRFRAVEAGRLDGVAHRTLRDRLLHRN
jgi:lipid II isoglutaminyl synthase (glutamine-hydrolysing)